MKTIQVGELKTHFSEILNRIKNGGEIVISYGRKREKIAKIIPYKDNQINKERKLGILKNKVKYAIENDFEITEDDFLHI